VDAHSAMVMAQGFTQEQVKSIIDDVDGSALIDIKTKKLLHLAAKTTRNAYKVTEDDIKTLIQDGCSEEEIFEAIAVTALFNYMDRMADALGAPVEGFQEMMAQMAGK
jgi:alkylhydroperoxidase family enzyme